MLTCEHERNTKYKIARHTAYCDVSISDLSSHALTLYTQDQFTRTGCGERRLQSLLQTHRLLARSGSCVQSPCNLHSPAPLRCSFSFARASNKPQWPPWATFVSAFNAISIANCCVKNAASPSQCTTWRSARLAARDSVLPDGCARRRLSLAAQRHLLANTSSTTLRSRIYGGGSTR